MEIYYFIFILLAIFSFAKDLGKQILIFLFICLTVFVGIRYNVGNDFQAYYSNFQAIKYNIGETVSSEPLYVLINYISPNFETVIFLFAFLSFLFLYRAFIVFNIKYQGMVLLIYYSLFLIIFNIHIIRQGLAISIILFSYHYLLNNKTKKFLIYVVIATLFHKSALFCLVLFPFLKLNFNSKLSLFVLLGSFLVGIFSRNLLDFFYLITSKIPILSNYANFYRIEEATNYGISIGIISDIVLLLCLYFSRNKLSESEFFLYKIFYVSVFFSFLFIVQPSALRLLYYFRIVNIFLFAILLYKNIIPRQVLKPLLLIFCYFYFSKNFNSEDPIHGRSDRNLPYKTIFNNENTH